MRLTLVLVLAGAVALSIPVAAWGQFPSRRRLPRPSPSMPTAGSESAPRGVDGLDPVLENPEQGAARTMLRSSVASAYADGVSAPSGADRPAARAVSNIVVAEPEAIPNEANASSFLWQWGQFLDHDLDLVETSATETFDAPVPAGDPWFDPSGTGLAVIPLFRSLYDPATGNEPGSPRRQLNDVTAFIDASNVYGSSAERASVLRAPDDSGGLLTSPRGMLPYNTMGMPNGGGSGEELFVAGDVRANEQIGLTALHTLFVREHNRLARMIRAADASLSGDAVYERARALVAAEMQIITYKEFLPILLGAGALRPYEGFRPDVDASIANLFATAAYRFGHSMLNEKLLRLERDGSESAAGHLPLAESFFNPVRLTEEGGLEPILRGLAWQRARRIDPYVTDAVRNFLFGPPGAGGFDLATLNIQRGRDHGLPDYNTVRRELGLAPKTSFAAISGEPVIQRRLEEAYGTVDRIDPWVGGLAEDHVAGALVGELIRTVLTDQFERLRDGDRCWYESFFDEATARQLERMRLSDIIRMNTMIEGEVPDDVFHAPAGAPF